METSVTETEGDSESDKDSGRGDSIDSAENYNPENEFNLCDEDWPSLVDSKSQQKLERKHVNGCMKVKKSVPKHEEKNAEQKNEATVKGKSSLKKKYSKDATKIRKVKLKKESEKKWKELNLEDTGFNLSLFPRPQYSHPTTDIYPMCSDFLPTNDDESGILDSEFMEFEEKGLPFVQKLRINKQYNFKTFTLRRDRHRKVERAGKQIKQKQCRGIQNNSGRWQLYVHHRILKLIQSRLNADRKGPNLPNFSNKPSLNNNWSAPANNKPAYSPSKSRGTRGPIQSLAHTLCQDNVPRDIDNSIASVLMAIQHRDLTPEDYEVLLRLDERVAPKTIADSTLQSFKTETINDVSLGESCPVCMDPYVVGDVRKFLPCGHAFHSNCIDMWLNNSSQNCPLDGLSVSS